MVTFLSWAVPVGNPISTIPKDLHQAMMLSEKTPQQQQQQQEPRAHSIPRKGGGIRGQSKLLVTLPESSVLANTNHSSSRTIMHGPSAEAQAQVDSNEWDPEDPEEQEDLHDETEGKVSNRWIDDTKDLVRKVDASMHVLIEEGVFGRERTESDPIRADGTGDSGDNVPHVPQGLDEVHVVGGLSNSLDGSVRSESLHEKEQPGGPDEESSSSQDERDNVPVIGGREPLYEKEQPGGTDEESSSQDEGDKEVHVVGGLSEQLDGSRSESLREKEQPGGPDEESSSSQDERDNVNVIGGREPLYEKEQLGGPDEESSLQDEGDKEVHVIGGSGNGLDGSRSKSLHEKEQPGGPDEESSSSQDERDNIHVIGGREPLHEKEQPGGPDEESSLQDAGDEEVHVIGGSSNSLDGSRSESFHEKEQPGGPDEESSSQETVEADAPEKVEHRPDSPAEDKYKGNNDPHGDEMHSSKDGESDTKQEIEKSHKNLLPTLEESALAQQRARSRERITTQFPPFHEASADEESPGRR
jgi:hypothetical protein